MRDQKKQRETQPYQYSRTAIVQSSQNIEGDSPAHKQQQKYVSILKRYFTTIRITISFINSLKEYSKRERFQRMDSLQWHRVSMIPFYPDDIIVIKWKYFVEFVTFLSVIIYPIYICFNLFEQFELTVLIFDIMFIIDVIMNFITGYIDENNNLILNYQQICQNYLKTWFLFDIVSALPIIRHVEGKMKYFKMIRVFKYFLFKRQITYKGQKNYVKVIETFDPHDEFQLKTGTKYLINVLITSCLLVHIFGCWQHFFDQGDYITNIYWASQTITTVGYGDVKTEHEFFILWMIIGVAFYSFTIGDFALMMEKSKANQEQEILFLVEQLGNAKKLPDKLKYKFLQFIKNNMIHNPFWSDEYRLMTKQLPHNLKLYMSISAMLDFCKQIPFFLYDINNTFQLLINIRYMIVEEGSIIYREGQNSSEIFFLLDGDIRIMTKDKGLLLNILEGTMFGEFEAIEEKLRGTYCIAQKKSICLVIPYRILRRAMEQSAILDFEIKQLHQRRRRLIINNFHEEKRKKTAYKRQHVKFYTQSFLQMTREEYLLEKKKSQLQNMEEYNKMMLSKLIGQRIQKAQNCLVKFKRSVHRVIEMNHLLDDTMPELWKELNNYQLIKRVFPKKYLKQKHEVISLSRKSSSVHSHLSRYANLSQQCFFQKLPEIRIKHLVLQHVRQTRNKFIPLHQSLNHYIQEYQEQSQQLQSKRKENIERSIWNKKFTKISQTVILRIDEIQESGNKYFALMQNMKKIEKLWLKGSMYKFELFQLTHGKEKSFLM
ncbi:unnamed protein product (macronuclear) [Paramecium tetraurelia]|uniref:Cyclic nucleotide-binding domain-containing protein n=1 Tax=Paramecium tetraurelia TaxID=5888 RepID=A0DVD3_PARTE|nr:uncharacterized protein GSPATT00020664001 [Paramecium tetraurelia]CAK87000.1 unnamed protein product [Paramecium tetraurelia]|eukprot:XP_001454397.1 hypothetical protein (macronuclear) [Paramecium tetraurelia strain d4-2]